jgi:hypothetical protein
MVLQSTMQVLVLIFRRICVIIAATFNSDTDPSLYHHMSHMMGRRKQATNIAFKKWWSACATQTQPQGRCQNFHGGQDLVLWCRVDGDSQSQKNR